MARRRRATTTPSKPIPADLADDAAEWREKLIETVAENDDEAMKAYLAGEEKSLEQLNAAIRRATIAGKLNPVVCGSAFKNKGVQPMLDAVVAYLPSPLDVGAIHGTLQDGETPAERQPTTASRSPPSRSRSRPTRTSAN